MHPTVRLSALITVALLGLAQAAQAQSSKPGLWEHRSTVQSGGGQMAQQMAEVQKQLAALPPDQRKAMEQMMRSQGMGFSSDGKSTTMRYCLTPEEAAKADIPSHDDDCKYTVKQRSASSMKVSFVCTDEGRTTGEGDFQFKGDTAYSGTFTLTTRIDGKPERMEMTQSGKWVSAQCGQVQPRPAKR